MDGKTIIRKLESVGWRHESTKGSHFKMKKSGFPPIIVPVHSGKDIKIGTLKNIEKVTGLKLRL